MFINMHFLLCSSFILWQNCHHPLLYSNSRTVVGRGGRRQTLWARHTPGALALPPHSASAHTDDEIKSKFSRDDYTHTHTHSQGLEKIRKTSSHSSTVPLSSLAPFRIVFTYIAWPAVSSSWSSPYNPPPSFYCAPVGLAQGRKGLSCRWNELWVKK